MLLHLPKPQAEGYSPLYFLAALGAGGLVVSFFMWLLFWLPYDTSMPVFDELVGVLRGGPLHQQLALLGAWAGILVFAWFHFRLLVWNLQAYARFRRTEAYRQLRAGNTETQLLAAPLTVAMSINVSFVLGMAFVPGLWHVVEWLFPLALLAFLAVGGWALALLRDFWGRVLTEGGFDCTRNNNFAQLLPSFAMSMVAVGLAAPAAMSQTTGVVVASLLLSSLFLVIAVVSGAVQLVLGMRAMLEHGADKQTAPTLWIMVPILTLVSITLLRQSHGIEVHLGSGAAPVQTFNLLVYLLMAQVAFGLLGWVVLRRYGYFRRFVLGDELAPGAYTLVCPGVAIAVMLYFFTNAGLVRADAIEPWGVAYWFFTALALTTQAATIWLVLRLNRKHFGRTRREPQRSRA
ncbi:MAG: TsoY family (seleno)protein [Halofilum sp. (in: g-proteobacteria)]